MSASLVHVNHVCHYRMFGWSTSWTTLRWVPT